MLLSFSTWSISINFYNCRLCYSHLLTSLGKKGTEIIKLPLLPFLIILAWLLPQPEISSKEHTLAGHHSLQTDYTYNMCSFISFSGPYQISGYFRIICYIWIRWECVYGLWAQHLARAGSFLWLCFLQFRRKLVSGDGNLSYTYKTPMERHLRFQLHQWIHKPSSTPSQQKNKQIYADDISSWQCKPAIIGSHAVRFGYSVQAILQRSDCFENINAWKVVDISYNNGPLFI